MLRVLMIPYLDVVDLSQSSCVNGMLTVAKSLLTHFPGKYSFTVVLPRREGSIDWKYPETEGTPGVAVLFLPAFAGAGYTETTPRFGAQYFSAFSQESLAYLRPCRVGMDIDVVWNAQSTTSLLFAQRYEHGRWSAAIRPPFLTSIPDVASDDKYGYFVSLKGGVWQKTDAFSALFDYGHCISPYEKSLLLKEKGSSFLLLSYAHG